jgi:hypothetical protein
MFSHKKFNFLLKFCVKMLLMDPDPGGPKTCGSGSGSGSPTLLYTKVSSIQGDFPMP